MTLLLYGAPEHNPDLFYAIPEGISDGFLYVESGDRRAAAVGVLDASKVNKHGIEVIDPSTLGRDDLLAEGIPRHRIDWEIALRTCKRLDVGRAAVPVDFPLGLGDYLRTGGVELEVDTELFVARRRRKTEAQIEGIRRAQRAADAAMATAAALIRELPDGLRSEDVRAAMKRITDEHGCDLPDDVIVAHGAQAADGHESGVGPLLAGESVVVDIWPLDRKSRCYADMTRTFVAGGNAPDAELAEFWHLCHESLQRVYPAVRADADGAALFALSCEPFHAAGVATQLSKKPGEILSEGYFHSLGHGVGLELHERPGLGRTPDPLVVGDVITLEPGCYRPGYGGCRLEDIVIVTEDGYEMLTDFPYDL